jgi:hypothetical protein
MKENYIRSKLCRLSVLSLIVIHLAVTELKQSEEQIQFPIISKLCLSWNIRFRSLEGVLNGKSSSIQCRLITRQSVTRFDFTKHFIFIKIAARFGSQTHDLSLSSTGAPVPRHDRFIGACTHRLIDCRTAEITQL